MSWTLARLGSRFSLLFEPHHHRVRTSALGRFLDEPIDLAVGLIEPDGTHRALPFTREVAQTRTTPGRGQDRSATRKVRPFDNAEQFERINSVTFRGYSSAWRLRFEFNVHGVFYPQDRALCLCPAFYLEMRVHATGPQRHAPAAGPTPTSVPLFIRVGAPGRAPSASAPNDRLPRIDFAYANPLRPEMHPRHEAAARRDHADSPPPPAVASVRERIVSLNPGAWPIDPDREGGGGAGLRLDLPVSDAGEGIKWRLVWAAHTADPVMSVRRGAGPPTPARLAYTDTLPDLDAVVADAIEHRDDRLALSRRFEKLLGQAPLDAPQQHLLAQSFQTYLGNTWWCTGELPAAETQAGAEADASAGEAGPAPRLKLEPGEGRRFPWFSVWEGSSLLHSTVDAEYNSSLFALCLWPDLLALQLRQWAERLEPHAASGGAILQHDLGSGNDASGQASRYRMAVEENSNFLLLLQTYTRWTGDRSVARALAATASSLTAYLLWCDRENDGFPDDPGENTMIDGPAALRLARRPTYPAVKRLAALQASADLLRLAGQDDAARDTESIADADAAKIESAAWLGDHYAIAADSSALERVDPDTGKPLPFVEIGGTDAYSIHTSNGLLLPAMIGRPALLDRERLLTDLISADRECASRYGGGHSSDAVENLRVSLNLWRDLFARYAGLSGVSSAGRYWDLQVISNTAGNSMGFADAYMNDELSHYPRGVVCLGWFLATPRLTIDRLAPAGPYLTVNPDRHAAQRWPLLPLADWSAGKVPVCVVSPRGDVHIEAPTDPVIVHGAVDSDPEEIEFIG
ncbi:glutaminase domain-containing protein [Phycisphaera mikurensis]|nr:DUF4965 domain-containing protein [Phycisphaera mikurensis]MBB6443362.1 hypothetical protein [Phycisphaera mikurensis]